MNKHTVAKLQEAHEKLGLTFPEQLFDFISKLDQPEVTFGEEEWLFYTLTDNTGNQNENFIITQSIDFKEEWGLNGLVFAANGIGDYLVVIPDEFRDKILIMLHETAELKLFAQNIQELIQYGPEDYFWSDNYLYKLDENNNLQKWEGHDDDQDDSDFFGDDYTLRNQLDDLIDDQRADKATDIIVGLEKLSESKDESHRAWAFNKLSDIYLKGFGPIPQHMEKALDYNQQAIDLNSHKALSNRAACYFFGMGMTKDLHKALELAVKANELSRSNMFADIFTTKEGGGLYENLIDMIKAEIKKAGK